MARKIYLKINEEEKKIGLAMNSPESYIISGIYTVLGVTKLTELSLEYLYL